MTPKFQKYLQRVFKVYFSFELSVIIGIVIPLAELKFQNFRNNQLESNHPHLLLTDLYSSDHITMQPFPHFQHLLRNAFIGFLFNFFFVDLKKIISIS